LDIFDIHIILADRYLDILNKSEYKTDIKKVSKGHLVKLLLELKENKDISLDKASRFIGFIQGVLCAFGLIDVDTERNFTRPMFQEYYSEIDIEQSSIEV